MCQKLAGQGDGLGGCATIRGGSWLDECDPSIKGLQERDEWGMSRDGQTLLTGGIIPICPDMHRHPAPGSPPFVPSFRTWGDQKGPMPESKGSLCPCVSPHLGFSERSEAGLWRHSSPRARPRNLETRVPWSW